MTRETNQIILLIVITGLIAGLSQTTFLSHKTDEAYVSNYTAIFYSDFVLEETYTYTINDPGKHFLYRYWKIDLSGQPLNDSHTQLLDIEVPEGTIGYLKDYLGEVAIYNNSKKNVPLSIEYDAFRNEAGAYSEIGYPPGVYTVKYWFKIYPPLETDDNFIHLNIMLADDHIHYENVNILVEDIGQIDSVFIHPPNLEEKKIRNMRVFSGEVFENELLEFELLIDTSYNEMVSGKYTYVEDVERLTVSSNYPIRNEYYLATFFIWLTKVSGYLMPVFFLCLWFIHGKEKNYTVPDFLTTVPVQLRKPWTVNLIFKKSVTDLDIDALYATLIDLHLRNKIRIEQNEKIQIRIISDLGLDSYETEVIDFLKGASEENVVTEENIESMITKAKSDFTIRGKLLGLKYSYERLVNGTNIQTASEFTVNGRSRLVRPLIYSVTLIIVAFFGYILSYHTESILFRAMGYSLVPLSQVLIAFSFPITLFGYWKDDYYKEKLQWESFKRNLTEFSRIQEYGVEDLNMWGSWLVYGTALGVGKKVSEALKKFKIDLDVPLDYSKFDSLIRPIMLYSYSAPSSRIPSSRGFSVSSRRSGGGFGGGRGFGGGGGGVR